MSTLSTKELFDYVLKDAMQHRKQFYSDISNTLLPATDKNSLLIAEKAKQIFDDNPDIDMDHLDVILGEPEYDESLDDDELLKKDYEYTSDTIDEQIDNEKLAQQLKDSLLHENRFFGINSTTEPSNRKIRKQQVQAARENERKVTLDKIINGLLKKTDISDDDKKEALLRILYNNAITPTHNMPADIKLTQRHIKNALEDAGVYDAVASVSKQPNFMNKQRVLTDQVPITYTSDKLFDKHGKEHSIFTPTEQTNALYDKFASKFLEDIANGTIKDVYDLSPYVMDIYKDSIKTMSYTDWLKVIEEEAAKINAAKEKSLGRPLTESEKVELEVPDDALTPEDWANFMPLNVKLGKSAAKKADNKLNRQHGYHKEAYKKYLDVVAGLRDPDSVESMMYEMEHGRTPEKELEHIKVDLIIPYCQRKLLKLQEEREEHEALGQSFTVRKIVGEQQYLQDILDLTDTGAVQLDNWARRYFSKKLRAEYGIEDQKPIERHSVMDEVRKYQNDPNTPEWAQSFYKELDKSKARAKKEASKKYTELPEGLKAQLNSFKEL
ncbi:MAG: hypothetical protein IKQ22_00690 [Clostridia bacterium]|nr:hypothetical protein [Clostridia bacterium]